jgi:RNA-directed DNA polymerase
LADPGRFQIVGQNQREALKEKTSGKDPSPVKEKIKKMDAVILGWVNYFCIAKDRETMETLDKWVRTRLRMGIWKQWKRPKTKVWNLLQLGINRYKACEWGNSRKGYCRIAHSPVLCRALNNDYFTPLRYIGFATYYYWKTKHQTKLF